MKQLVKAGLLTAVFMLLWNVAAAQATIGTRNGTSYSVISTRYVYEASAGYCGFNDLSIPNQAKFKVETLQYEEYDNGRFVRSWTEERKTFVECYTP